MSEHDIPDEAAAVEQAREYTAWAVDVLVGLADWIRGFAAGYEANGKADECPIGEAEVEAVVFAAECVGECVFHPDDPVVAGRPALALVKSGDEVKDE